MFFSPRLAAAVLLLANSVAAHAHSFSKGDIVVSHPWTRATPDGAPAGSGYVKITNNGKEADRLLGGTFDGAEAVEIHEMKMDGDIMKMRELKEGLEIKPSATVEISPGGTHLMFTGLKNGIQVGPDHKATLKFEKAGSIDVEFRIEPIGATESVDHNH
jgi:periplasmic copper chaperone A